MMALDVAVQGCGSFSPLQWQALRLPIDLASFAGLAMTARGGRNLYHGAEHG
jgi:hypothetical protein